MAGKVTVGLASHRPCGTDFSGLSTYVLKGCEREMNTPPMLRRGMVHVTLLEEKARRPKSVAGGTDWRNEA